MSLPNTDPIFEVVDDDAVAVLTGTIDGITFLSAAQVAARFGRTEAHWTRNWHNVWRRVLDAREKESPVLPDPPVASGAGDDSLPTSPSSHLPISSSASACVSVEQLARLEILRRVVYSNLNDDQWKYFLDVCANRRLNPFSKQIIPEPRYDHVRKMDTVEIITSVHALNLIADRTGKLRGIEQTKYCGPDREWVEVWTESVPPIAAKTGVLKAGAEKPYWGVATMEFYAPPLAAAASSDSALSSLPEFWVKDKGVYMLGKCSLALALRAAFPEELGGLYSFEETRGTGGRSQEPVAGSPEGGMKIPQPRRPASPLDDGAIRYEPDPEYDPRTQVA